MERKLMDFVNDLNKGGEFTNCIVYLDGVYEPDTVHNRLVFKRNHKENYFKLLKFCAENFIMVVKTNPGTYETIVRIDGANE